MKPKYMKPKMKPTYQIIRNDGRQVPRYNFDTRAEAEKCIAEMSEPERSPFTYRVVAREN